VPKTPVIGQAVFHQTCFQCSPMHRCSPVPTIKHPHITSERCRHFSCLYWNFCGGSVAKLTASDLWLEILRSVAPSDLTFSGSFTHICLCHQAVEFSKLENIQAHHATNDHGLAASAGVWPRATESEISATLCTKYAWVGLYFIYCIWNLSEANTLLQKLWQAPVLQYGLRKNVFITYNYAE